MQENEQQNGQWHGGKCNCHGWNGCGGHHMGFHILRWVLGIIIILMTFSFGVQIGEFKSALENSGYGHHEMYYRSIPVGNMMYGGQTGAIPAATVQSSTVAK
jgi:hypothetical protein